MNLHYRILKLDETEFSFTVRYFTDLLSERELSIDANEQSDTPARCRTDYNLNLWRDMTEAQLHQHIAQSAPVVWLARKERAKAKSPEYVQSLAMAKEVVGETFSRPALADGTLDMNVPPMKKP